MLYCGMNIYQLTELNEQIQPQKIIDKMNELYGYLKTTQIENKKEKMEQWNLLLDGYEKDPNGYYEQCAEKNMFERVCDLMIPIKITLKTVKNGLTKTIKYKVSRINKFTGERYEEINSQTIKIERGVLNGEEYIFEGKGNEEIGKKRGNAVFFIDVISQDFIRNNENLILRHPITKEEQLNGFLFSHRGVDDDEWLTRKIEANSVHFDDPHSAVIFFGRGLPRKSGDLGDFGDVYVVFTQKTI